MNMNSARRMALFIFAIVMSLGIFVVILFNNMMMTKENNQSVIDSENRAKWDYITLILNQEYADALSQAESVRGVILQDIKQEYGTDVERLEADLEALYKDSENGGDTFIDILNNSISGVYFKNIRNDNNDLNIFTRYKIISDNSINCSALDRERTFDLEAAEQFAPALAKTAMDSIILQQTSPTFWHYPTVTPDLPWSAEIASMSRMDLDEIKSLFFKYQGDMRVFEGFEFISTAYIYDREDLLGNTLVNKRGKAQESYQLIINQGFNLLDVIDKNATYKSTIQAFELDIVWLQNSFMNEAYLQSLTLLSLVLLFTVVFLTLSHIRNKIK